MSRDKILGLALGILVLGFTGAFCFRPEQKSVDPIPQLNNPAKLDRQIAEKSVMPYLTGVEGVDSRNPVGAGADSISGSAAPQPPAWNKPDFLNEDRKSGTRQSNTQAPPDPIPPIAVGQLGHNRAWQPAPQPPAPAKEEARPATYTNRSHQVARGETLSGLASRYLGSSARYMDLFEANRDILASPHNLRPGMVIRIPDSATHTAKRGTQPARPVSGSGGAAGRSEVELLPGPAGMQPNERFRPVRHSPLMPRDNSRTSQKQDDKRPVKRLTQIPPTGFPGIDSLLSILNGAVTRQLSDAPDRTTAAAPDEASQTR